MKKRNQIHQPKWDPRWGKCFTLITQDKRKPRAVKQGPEATDLNNLLGYCRLGFLPPMEAKKKKEDARVRAGRGGGCVGRGVGPSPAPLGSVEQRPFQSYSPGPGVQRHSGCHSHPRLPPLSAIQPAPRGLEPQACTPRELDWGPGKGLCC